MTTCDCLCSEEYGPCHQHADFLVVRQGVASHSADELALLLVSDLIDCGIELSDEDTTAYDRLSSLIEYDLGVGRYSSDDDSEAGFELADRVESYASDLWVTHDDGYVIARPHPDCPLLNDHGSDCPRCDGWIPAYRQSCPDCDYPTED